MVVLVLKVAMGLGFVAKHWTLVVDVGVVGVGGLGCCRGCGWVLGECGKKKKKKIFLIIF